LVYLWVRVPKVPGVPGSERIEETKIQGADNGTLPYLKKPPYMYPPKRGTYGTSGTLQ
jgi:hypothetical protein